MDSVLQCIEQDNEQNGVLDADKALLERDIELTEVPSDTVRQHCTCGAVVCAAELSSIEDLMAHQRDDAVVSSSTEAEHVRLGELRLGRQSHARDDYVVALRVIPERGGRQTFAKLGLY